jgi:hypothetical protein
MGQLATTIVGGVVGFAIGGPFGAQVGMMLGGMIGATLFGPTVHGPRLNDLKVTASTYGVAIPEIYGTVRVGGNMIWTSGIKETKKSSRPGKGGPKQTTYSYDATFAMALCKGEVEEILRIWADSKIIYDKTGGTTRAPAPAGSDGVFQTLFLEILTTKKKKKTINVRLYRGDENQLPDSLIEADKGVGNVSAHRGLSYVVFERLQLENFGNRIPQMTFEVTKARTRGLAALPVRDRSGVIENTANRDWLPDFASGRLLSFDRSGDGTKLYNMADNTLIAEDETMNFDLTDKSYSLIEGQNALLVANFPAGVGFSYYNTGILTKINEYNTASGTTNIWDPVAKEITLATNGKIGHGRFVSGVSGSVHVVHTDVTGTTFLMDSEGRLLNEFDAPFQPDVFLEGRRDASNSQIIGWRFANDQLEMFEVKTDSSAIYTTILEAGTETWVPQTDFAVRSINLKPYPAEKFQPLALVYDPTDDHFFCLGVDPDKYNDIDSFGNGGGVIVFKYSLETNSYKFLVKHGGTPVPRGLTQNMRASRLAGGTFGWIGKPAVGDPTVNQVSLQNGSLENLFEAQDDFGSGLTGVGDQYWDDETDSIFADRIVAGVTNSYRLRVSDSIAQVTVPAIVEDICVRSGILALEDIDITELDASPLVGYSLDRMTTARDALKQMATAFLFDGYESDYKLKFRSRGGDTIVNIPEDWMAREGEDGVIKETITQELEMPVRISVNYYDIARDHQQNSQTAKRKVAPYPTMWTAKEDLIDLPITWDADSAKQCADKLLKMAWANRVGHQFNLPWRYLKYDPTDVITITMENETTYNLRLTEANIGSNFSIEAQAVSEVATAYVSTATGAQAPAPIQTVEGDGTAFPIIMNTPLLRDVDYDTTGSSICYFSAGTNEISFNGAAVYIDDGSDYQAVGVIDNQTTTGYAIDALPNTNSYEATDETTVIRVRLSDPSMELESVTQDDILNFEANSALIGNEIIQFRDATLLPTGEWALSGILRARRGTNYAVKGHQRGENFLLVNSLSTGKFSRPPESYVTTRLFKAAPLSVPLSDVVPISVDLIPRDLMPYTPEAVKVTDDATDVVISAERRSRVTASLRDGVSTIHYKEGDMLSARIETKVWFGKGLADVNSVGAADLTLTSYLFDAAGVDIPVEATFPVASMGAEDTVLIQLAEIGEVTGTPKWVQATRYGTGLWDLLELY